MVKCHGCGKESKGNMPTTKINGQERSYCADCYWKIDKEYKAKKNCEDCSYFSAEECKKKNKKLKSSVVGFNTYYIEAEGCGEYSTDSEVAVAEIKKLETAGKFDEAATAYERQGMYKEAKEARDKVPVEKDEVEALVKDLSRKGKTLTYYCIHCGAPLQIGAKAEKIPKTCPKCKGNLELFDLGKFIQQHI